MPTFTDVDKQMSRSFQNCAPSQLVIFMLAGGFTILYENLQCTKGVLEEFAEGHTNRLPGHANKYIRFLGGNTFLGSE